MKKVILFALVLAVHVLFLNSVLAQETPRYVITYIRSQTGTGIRSATAITVINQSSRSCEVQVGWFLSSIFSPIGISSVLVSGGTGVQFCSRSLPNSITRCNSTSNPELDSETEVQGRAIVFSSDEFECSLLAIDARVYYTTGDRDTAISAISNPKIVFYGEGNLGD
jgi:hypothetical protein